MPTPTISHSPTTPRAAWPHCDNLVLHAPGTCRACDHYPDWQAQRAQAAVNFTGQHDPARAPCPSERRRPLNVIEHWPGNRPWPWKEQP